MSHRITRDRLTAAAVLVLALLVLAASVEAGQNVIEAALTAGTSYGMALIAAALVFALMKAPVGIRSILKATRSVIAVAVVVALVLVGMGKAVVEVFS
ncbi:hypothetical protein [Streptomyces sp. NPDC059604]|uniref:hypothetical protein n=1 Tax=Streptomyces sp. NPDC059604 TaxID=3346881 RepID=UPI00369A3066